MRNSSPTPSLLLRVSLCLGAVCWSVSQASPSAQQGLGLAGTVGVQHAQAASIALPKTYLWLSPEEIRALPIAGEPGCDSRCSAAWTQLREAATVRPDRPNLDDRDEDTGNVVLAKALVAVRLGDSEFTRSLRKEVADLLDEVIGTENGASALSVGRKLAVYVIAADIIDLPVTEPEFDKFVFRPWLRSIANKDFAGGTLRYCHENRPNNWGTYCGASRIAVALYLDDRSEIVRAARVFQGWLGDRQSYTGFRFEPEAFSWMSDPTCPPFPLDCRPRPINPPRAIMRGHNVDGVIVDDQRRSERFRFRWPPNYTVYTYGALGGAVLQAGILRRFGFDTWHWSDEAIRRAVEWLYYDGDGKHKWDTCDDTNKRYVLDLVDHAYGSDFIGRMACSPEPSKPGRNIAWTSWTHQRVSPSAPRLKP